MKNSACWEAAADGWARDGSLSEDVTEHGGGPSTLTVPVRWPATRLLAKAQAASKVHAQRVMRAAMAAERRAGGMARTLQRARADETCCFRPPAAGDLEGQDDEPAPRRSQQLGARVLLGFALGMKGGASNTAAVAARRSIGVERGNQSDADCQLRSAPKRESSGVHWQ